MIHDENPEEGPQAGKVAQLDKKCKDLLQMTSKLALYSQKAQ